MNSFEDLDEDRSVNNQLLPEGTAIHYAPDLDTSGHPSRRGFEYYSLDISGFTSGTRDQSFMRYLATTLDLKSDPHSRYYFSSDSYCLYSFMSDGSLIWSPHAPRHDDLVTVHTNATGAKELARLQAQKYSPMYGVPVVTNEAGYYLNFHLFTTDSNVETGKWLAWILHEHIDQQTPCYLDFRSTPHGLSSGTYNVGRFRGMLSDYPQFARAIGEKE